MQKPLFLVILEQKGQFWTFFCKNDKNGENYQKSALSVKFQKEKVMNSFREKASRSTDIRTNITPKVSNDRWSRDQKCFWVFCVKLDFFSKKRLEHF